MTERRFYILDERNAWHEAACAAARRRGYTARRILKGREVAHEGVGFIRPHADWRKLPDNREDYRAMRRHLLMIQDVAQVEVYERKSEQFARWGDWMPETWRFTDREAALDFVDHAPIPLVSKADVGASSVNVRVLTKRQAALEHIGLLFGRGIQVAHGAACPKTIQKGYALLQRFIPHEITWRVNAIGDARAIFKRYCYKDRPVAQTGNVEPVMRMTDEVESLLDFSDRFFAHAGTNWCAIDVLRDVDGSWKLLETSLAWPWPSPGDCDNGVIFRSAHKWIGMFEAMFDELERGAWQ